MDVTKQVLLVKSMIETVKNGAIPDIPHESSDSVLLPNTRIMSATFWWITEFEMKLV